MFNPFAAHSEITVYPDRAAWLAARATPTIGGSDAPALWNDLGDIDGAFGDPLSLYARKLGGIPEPETEEKWLKRGRLMEPVILAEYQDEHPDDEVIKWPEYTVLTSKRWPWLTATLDFPIIPGTGDPFPLECKNRIAHAMGKWAETATLPVNLQCQHYLAVTGAPRAMVAVDFGSGTRFVDVPRDEELIELHVDATRRFLDTYLIPRVPPQASPSEASREALKALHTKWTHNTVVLPASAIEDAANYLKAKATIKAAKEIADGCQNRLLQLVGDHEHGVIVDAEKIGRYTVVMTRVRESQRKASTVAAYRRFDVKIGQ